jgi:hypothetical protein
MARHDDNASAPTAEARLRLLRSHLVLYSKLCCDGRLAEPQREKVCLQYRLERALLPYSLRHAGQFGGALRATLNNAGIVSPWATAIELCKTIAFWTMSLISRGGDFRKRVSSIA